MTSVSASGIFSVSVPVNKRNCVCEWAVMKPRQSSIQNVLVKLFFIYVFFQCKRRSVHFKSFSKSGTTDYGKRKIVWHMQFLFTDLNAGNRFLQWKFI